MPVAAIYARQSRDPDLTRAAVSRQEKACRELAARLGWEIAAVYTDSDISAYSGKPRPGYAALLNAIKGGEVDALLLYAADRLYRRMTDLESFLEVAEPRKLPVATVAAGELDLGTDQGRMVARILAATAQGEVERKADRQRRANDQKATAGRPHWSTRPYGYRLVDGRVEVVPVEAVIIREAVTRLLAGEQTGAVARDLTDRGLRTSTGARWSVTTLRRVVASPRVAGLRVHRGAPLGAGDWPAIVSADEHAQIVALFGQPGRKVAPDNRVKHLLSGLIRCGRCIEVRMLSFRSAYGVPSYRCPRCYMQRKAEPVEELVVELVLGRLAMPDAADLLVAADSRPGQLVAELEEVRRRQAFVGEKYAAGSLSDVAYSRADADLRAREDRLTGQLAAVAVVDPAAALAAAADPAKRWAELPLLARRRVIERLVDIAILPAEPGRSFDPRLVVIEWRTT